MSLGPGPYGEPVLSMSCGSEALEFSHGCAQVNSTHSHSGLHSLRALRHGGRGAQHHEGGRGGGRGDQVTTLGS